MSDLHLEICRLARRTVVHCQGRLDSAGIECLTGALQPLFEEKKRVTLCLEGVIEVDHAGVLGLARLRALALDFGEDIRVNRVSVPVREAMDRAGLTEELTRFSSHFTPRHPDSEDAKTRRKQVAAIREMFLPPEANSPGGELEPALGQMVQKVAGMRTGTFLLGHREPVDLQEATTFRMPESGLPLSEVVEDTTSRLNGMVLPGHPMTQHHPHSAPTIASLLARFAVDLHNPNAVSADDAPRVSETEIACVHATADLVGFDPARAGGFFTFGGTGTVLYANMIGLQKAVPGAMERGIRNAEVRVVASRSAHWASMTACGWLGIGSGNLITVPVDADSAMDLAELERILRQEIAAGRRICGIMATAGTTDAFGLDNLAFVVQLRDQLVEEFSLDYRPHIHADAVIGWAFTVFNDYDFEANPLGFCVATLRSLWDTREHLQHLHLVDSIGIDFHKVGYAPYTNTLFMCRERQDFGLIARSVQAMPQLVQFGSYNPGAFTLECSRSGGAILAAAANLQAFGKNGLRALLGHTVAMAEHLRDLIEHSDFAVVLNDHNCGPNTIFRVYPHRCDPRAIWRNERRNESEREKFRAHNRYNLAVFDHLARKAELGEGVILSKTTHYGETAYGEPVLGIQSFVMSAFTEPVHMDRVFELLRKACAEVPLC